MPHRREDAATFSDLSLLLSLVFGCGQALIGAFVAQRIIRARRWPSLGAYLLLLLSLWFLCSGVAELTVSGMDVAHRLTGALDAATFARWRGLVDAALIGATLLLAVALLAYPLLWSTAARWRRTGDTVQTQPRRVSDD